MRKGKKAEKKRLTKRHYLGMLLVLGLMGACTDTEEQVVQDNETAVEETVDSSAKVDTTSKNEVETSKETSKEEVATQSVQDKEQQAVKNQSTQAVATRDMFEGYKMIEVDPCNTSGTRQANVVVDIGYGERKYWAFTNEYGQLVRVVADEITIQNDNTEPVKSHGRYCNDEAKVAGVESSDLDEGHIIADSLGGVSNAYNITPQNATLNRHGDQAYMEENIRKAGGATNFEAIITYPNTTTQTPSSYQYTYTIKGTKVVDKFDNVNPDKVNVSSGLTTNKQSSSTSSNSNSSKASSTQQSTPVAPSTAPVNDLSKVDTNGNGKVTIKEAKDAGYQMPLYSDHWLYPYMDDRDNDGVVGE